MDGEEGLDEDGVLAAGEVLQGVGVDLVGDAVLGGDVVDDLLDRAYRVTAGQIGAEAIVEELDELFERPEGELVGLGCGSIAGAAEGPQRVLLPGTRAIEPAEVCRRA